jgi:sarcosine oxidase subunit gamma
VSAPLLTPEYPLAARGAFEALGLRMRAIPPAACVRLQMARRVEPGERLPPTGSIELPLEPNTVGGSDPFALWLSPDGWLIVSDRLELDGLRQALEPLLAARRCALTDASSALERIELSGPRARDLLASGCALDLHPQHFASGRCARTRFAQVAVVLRPQVADSFELYVDRSLAEWVWGWITDGAVEGGFAPEPQ